jgi:hypothetical protein
MNLEELSHATASKYVEEKQIKSALAYFVNQVRDDGLVNKYLLAFIADGVERHLAGKKPWPAKQGRKPDLTVTFPYYYEYLKLKGAGDIYNKVAYLFNCDERTAKRHIDRAREHLEGDKRRITNWLDFSVWCQYFDKEVPEQFR